MNDRFCDLLEAGSSLLLEVSVLKADRESVSGLYWYPAGIVEVLDGQRDVEEQRGWRWSSVNQCVQR